MCLCVCIVYNIYSLPLGVYVYICNICVYIQMYTFIICEYININFSVWITLCLIINSGALPWSKAFSPFSAFYGACSSCLGFPACGVFPVYVPMSTVLVQILFRWAICWDSCLCVPDTAGRHTLTADFLFLWVLQPFGSLFHIDPFSEVTFLKMYQLGLGTIWRFLFVSCGLFGGGVLICWVLCNGLYL